MPLPVPVPYIWQSPPCTCAIYMAISSMYLCHIYGNLLHVPVPYIWQSPPCTCAIYMAISSIYLCHIYGNLLPVPVPYIWQSPPYTCAIYMAISSLYLCHIWQSSPSTCAIYGSPLGLKTIATFSIFLLGYASPQQNNTGKVQLRAIGGKERREGDEYFVSTLFYVLSLECLSKLFIGNTESSSGELWGCSPSRHCTSTTTAEWKRIGYTIPGPW